jgi:hypothetical protein
MGLEPSQQREVWQEAVETAPNGKLTAAHVEAGRNGGQGIEQVRFLLGSEQKVRTYFRSSSIPEKHHYLKQRSVNVEHIP